MMQPKIPQTSKLFGEHSAAIAEQLRARLAATRATLQHRGVKGTQVESAVREQLAQFLPRKYSLGTGEVIDTTGTRSQQTDVLVLSDDQPFTLGADDPGLYLVEGVLAAGEVKTVLTSKDLETTLAAAATFKQLRAKPGVGTVRLATQGDAHFHECPPYFLLAFESQLTLEAIADRVRAATEASGQPAGTTIDAVFVLDRGEVINLGKGNGSLGVVAPDGSKYQGWIIHQGSEVLFGLVVWLSLSMPRSRRMVPILPDYLVATLS